MNTCVIYSQLQEQDVTQHTLLNKRAGKFQNIPYRQSVEMLCLLHHSWQLSFIYVSSTVQLLYRTK